LREAASTEPSDPRRAALWEVVMVLRAERRLREQRRATQRVLIALTIVLALTGCALAVIGRPYGGAVLLIGLALAKLSMQDES
jgi:hypothetical protein